MFRVLKPYQLVVDVSVAVAFFLVATPIEVVVSRSSIWPFVPPELAAVLISALFSGALGLRRVSPGLSLVVAWVAALIQMTLGMSPGFADVAIFGVLYATAAHGSRRTYWAGFVSALVGAVVITLYLLLGPLFAAGSLTWQTLPTALVMLVAAAFALGLSWTVGALVRTAVRARENRVAQVLAEEEAVVEQERVRIARDMHDVVAHSLAVVIAQADGARYAAPSNPDAATDALGTISTTARAALADVRLLLTQLRHSQGDGPQPVLADLEGLYAQVRASGVELRVSVDPMPPGEPPAAVQLAVYRILQEALTNALRHSGGPVSVSLAWQADRVDVGVRNPLVAGVGASGHGLVGMRERASLVGGRLDARAVGAEFVVDATIPIGGLS